ALLMGSWFWLVPLAVDVANHMSSYVLSDHAVHQALRRSFVAGKIDTAVWPILWVLLQLAMAMVMLILIVLKYVMVILFACLYVGGPAAIGLGALPRIGPMFVGVIMRALLTLMIIPLVWTIVFAAWAGLGAGTLEAFTHFKLLKVLMGPGLFLAGVVVLLAITRRLFAMAVGGMRLSVPGAGIARAAISMAIGRALGAKMIDATSPGGKGPAATDAVKTLGTPGDRDHVQSEIDRGIRPRSTPLPPRRRLPTNPGEARAEQVANQQTRRDDMGAAIGDGTDTAGVRKGHRPSEAELTKYRADVEESAATWGGHAPVERLREVGQDMKTGDRAIHAGMAARAYRQYPNDQAARDRLYRHDQSAHYAGRDMLPETRDAIITSGAAGVDNVLEAYGPDLARFDQPLWASTPQGQAGLSERAGTSKYDFRGTTPDGRAAMKDEYDRRKRKDPGGALS
ncbi:MAG: hypothetical protein M3Z57_05245, partial [Candidatus Dormibacteraeota bacterium]|nr:hypothetical protein [Candidatus Dormibacteraeota bacterium]